MADVNGFRQEFPTGYVNTVKSMIEFYANICFPDYSNPCFSDAKLGDRPAEIRNYQDWLKLFPDCEWIRYYATEGREGTPLPNLSHGALTSGFFTFRNGWKQDATVMVVKAGPKGNGTASRTMELLSFGSMAGISSRIVAPTSMPVMMK